MDAHAQARKLTPPSYPEADKKAGRSGVVTILLRIDEEGNATIDRVMGLGPYGFLRAVTDVAQTWRFEPSRRDNRLVPDVLEFVVVFDSKDGVRILGPLYRP